MLMVSLVNLNSTKSIISALTYASMTSAVADNFYRTFSDNDDNTKDQQEWLDRPQQSLGPVITGDKLEAKTHLKCSKQGKKQGKWVT